MTRGRMTRGRRPPGAANLGSLRSILDPQTMITYSFPAPRHHSLI